METHSCVICGMTRERAKQCGIRVLLHTPKNPHQNERWRKVVRRQDNFLAKSLLLCVCSRHFYQGFPSHFPQCQDYAPRDELVCKETPLNYYQFQMQLEEKNKEADVDDSTKVDSQMKVHSSKPLFGCKLCPTFYDTERKLDEHRIETHTTECQQCKRTFFVTEQSQNSKICSVCECKRRKPLVHHRPLAPKPAPPITTREIDSINPDVFIPTNFGQTRTVYKRINRPRTKKILSSYACVDCKMTLAYDVVHRTICKKCQASFCASRRSKNSRICPDCSKKPTYACVECERKFDFESDLNKHKVRCKECCRLFCTDRRFKQTDCCPDCKYYKLYFDHFKCGYCNAKFHVESAFELHLQFCVEKKRMTEPVSNLVPLMQQIDSKATGPLADHPRSRSGSRCKFCKDKISMCFNCDRTMTKCYICASYLPQSALARHIRAHPDRDTSTQPISTETISIGEMKEDEKNVLSEFDVFKNSEKVVFFGGIDLLDEKPIKSETGINYE